MNLNLHQLSTPPSDILDYVKPPAGVEMDVELRDWLTGILKNKTNDIHIPECWFETLAQVENELSENYKVQYIAIPGKTASAEFFLKRLPAK